MDYKNSAYEDQPQDSDAADEVEYLENADNVPNEDYSTQSLVVNVPSTTTQQYLPNGISKQALLKQYNQRYTTKAKLQAAQSRQRSYANRYQMPNEAKQNLKYRASYVVPSGSTKPNVAELMMSKDVANLSVVEASPTLMQSWNEYYNSRRARKAYNEQVTTLYKNRASLMNAAGLVHPRARRFAGSERQCSSPGLLSAYRLENTGLVIPPKAPAYVQSQNVPFKTAVGGTREESKAMVKFQEPATTETICETDNESSYEGCNSQSYTTTEEESKAPMDKVNDSGDTATVLTCCGKTPYDKEQCTVCSQNCAIQTSYSYFRDKFPCKICCDKSIEAYPDDILQACSSNTTSKPKKSNGVSLFGKVEKYPKVSNLALCESKFANVTEECVILNQIDERYGGLEEQERRIIEADLKALQNARRKLAIDSAMLGARTSFQK